MVAQYFAQIDGNNIVTSVHVVSQEFLDANPERYTGRWVETFFNTEGKNYAGVDMEYLEAEQDFRLRQPYLSWAWANDTWNPPTSMPTTGTYRWNETELAWVAI